MALGFKHKQGLNGTELPVQMVPRTGLAEGLVTLNASGVQGAQCGGCMEDSNTRKLAMGTLSIPQLLPTWLPGLQRILHSTHHHRSCSQKARVGPAGPVTREPRPTCPLAASEEATPPHQSTYTRANAE